MYARFIVKNIKGHTCVRNGIPLKSNDLKNNVLYSAEDWSASYKIFLADYTTVVYKTSSTEKYHVMHQVIIRKSIPLVQRTIIL